jgi:hypothetical protein
MPDRIFQFIGRVEEGLWYLLPWSRLMRQIVYTMQFKGEVRPVGTSPNVMKVTTVAASCICIAAMGPHGVQATIESAAGQQATFESEVTFLGGFESSEATSAGEGGFKETGMITFGEGEHRLRFSTIGQGYIGPSAEPNLRQGAVMWQVEGGEGQFKGAQGLITSNFTISAAGDVTDHHTGVIFAT